MKLLTWNIQWGLGCDGRVDLERIAREVRRFCDADILCFQEVTDGFDDLRGNDGANQFAALAALFEGYSVAFFAAVDMPGPRGRRRFGNMILSRLPVGQIIRQSLPWGSAMRGGNPAECMPRALLDVTIEAPFGPLRIVTTHLEWSSPALRAPQIEALRENQLLAARRAVQPPAMGKGPYCTALASAEAILCGDFNMRPDDPLLARLQAPFDEASTPVYRDAWRLRNGDAAHPPSMCVHDQADGPSRCLDYVFVTEGLTGRIRGISYDQTSQASDHQPVILELA